jgi:hypothetical protein
LEEYVASIFRFEDIAKARNQRESKWQEELTFFGLHGVISQKIVLFITTGVTTSNPT